jgi:hypothetical protein
MPAIPACDALRSVAAVLRPDVRNDLDGKSIHQLHALLSEIVLHDGVPVEVREQFETARNLSLYSWFVYRFHPIASVPGYASLEAALRIRVAADFTFRRPKGQKHAGFKPMLKHAVASGWIQNEGFDNALRVSRARASHKAMIEQIRSNPDLDCVPVRDPTPAEIERELRALPYTENLVESIPAIRNHLAHGHPFLDAGSVGVLRIVAEAINQLFPGSHPASSA